MNHKPNIHDWFTVTRLVYEASSTYTQRIRALLLDIHYAMFESEPTNEALSKDDMLRKNYAIKKKIKTG